MSVILLDNLRAARAARNLAESMSSDPGARQRARVRAMNAVMRRERLLKNPQPAEVVVLPLRRPPEAS